MPDLAGPRHLPCLEGFRNPEADALALLRQLVADLRPRRREEQGEFVARHEALLQRLEADPALLAAFRRHLLGFLASRRLVAFFTDSGILPGTGFFSEWWRILWHPLLPDALDPRRLKDCVHLIFDHRKDWCWLEGLPPEAVARFWERVAPAADLEAADWAYVREEMLAALLLLAHRVSGLGVESELLRATPDFEDHAPRFIALSSEALDFAKAIRARIEDPAQPPEDGAQLLVIVDQCRESLQRIRKRSLSVGTSLHLTYVLTRGEQSLGRLTELVDMLAADANAPGRGAGPAAWAAFVREALLAETRRNSLSHYLNRLLRLLALRVTDNAARSGEHYISETPKDYLALWKSAMGAGLLIAVMALIKIFVAGLDLPLFGQAALFSLDYGLGFVIIYMLGFTVATKQPAMTAQTLAARLSDLNLNRGTDLERIAELVAAVIRSQLAAIAGNICVAFPTALAIALVFMDLKGDAPVSPYKATRLLEDLDLRGWAIPHAAIAGFYLYLAGLISGFFDNQAAYNQVGERVARLPWLIRLAGPARAARAGAYLGEHLGGLMGNFLFGCMLGSTGILGIILGLPLDIRHIAFSSANLAYAITGLHFGLTWQAVLWGILGVLVIGLTNLAVSFSLALRTALGARRVSIDQAGRLLAALGRRLRTQPRSFFLPPRE